MDAPVRDVKVFTKNRDRLVEGEIARGVRLTDRVAGRRGAADQQAQGEGTARAAASGPVRWGDGADAGVV